MGVVMRITKRPPYSRILVIFCLVIILFLPAACSDTETNKDPATIAEQTHSVTLVTNARIYTFDADNTFLPSGSLAFDQHGEILALGETGPMASAFPDATQLNLEGKTVIPGLIDSHGHLYGLALSFTQANLSGTTSKSEVMSRLREFEADLPAGEWLLGRGWDQNDWPEQRFPDRADLDAEFPDRPVWLRRIDGHAAWGNSAAIAQADKDLSGDWQEEGGFIHRDSMGEPTGIFIDGAMSYVDQTVPGTSPDLIDAALDAATQTLASLGLTGVHDPGVDRQVIELYRKKITEDAFPVRVYAMADGVGATTRWLCDEGPLEDPSGRLVMRSVKLYADGALGSRGAALLEDYSDEPGNRGLMFTSTEQMDTALDTVFSCGLQAGVHAIGDAANRMVLDAYERKLTAYPDNPGRHRVEHVQILHPDDIPRFAQLDVIAAMQPTHATSDMYWADERLGEQRLAGAYAWQSLLDSGARLAFGSDFPVEQVDPMLGIYAAVSRQDTKGWPEGGWLPAERISREAAIRAFTLDAAYAGFMENQVGSLEVGKRADFVVFGRDIMEIPIEQIPELQVAETWVDGKRVFQRQTAK